MKKLLAILLTLSFYSGVSQSFTLSGPGSTDRNNLTVVGRALGIVGTTTGPYGIKGVVGLISVGGSSSSSTFVGINGISVSTNTGVVSISGGNPYLDVTTANTSFGHSYLFGVGLPNVATQNYGYVFNTYVPKTAYTALGGPGTGFTEVLGRMYSINIGNGLNENQDKRQLRTVLTGINDITKTPNIALLFSTVGTYFDTYQIEHYLDNFYFATDMTKTADWINVPNPTTFVTKSALQSNQTKFAIYSNNTTGSVNYENVKVVNGLVVGWIGSSPDVAYGTLQVLVDGVVIGTIDENYQADGNTTVGAGGLTLTISDNKRCAKSTVFWNVTPGFHKVTFRATTSAFTTLDYVATLADPARCKPLIIAEITKLPAGGYVAMNPSTLVTNTTVDAMNLIIRNSVNSFKSRGYPTILAETNTLNTATDFQADLVHPNTLGSINLANIFLGAYNYFSLTQNVEYIRRYNTTVPSVGSIPIYNANGTLGSSSIIQNYFGNQIRINTSNFSNPDGTSTLVVGTNNTSGSIFNIRTSTNTDLFTFNADGSFLANSQGKFQFFNSSNFIRLLNGLEVQASQYVNLVGNNVTSAVFSQFGVCVGCGTNPLNSSSPVSFDLQSITKGMRINRLSTTARNAASDAVWSVQLLYPITVSGIPVVTIIGGGCSSVAVTAAVTSGTLTGFTIGNVGFNCTSAPLVSVVGYPNAQAIARLIPEAFLNYNTTNKTLNYFNGDKFADVVGYGLITSTGSNYTLTGFDAGFTIGCNSTLRGVNLPASMPVGVPVFIKDQSGTAATTPITITATNMSIDGVTTFLIGNNYGGVSIYFNGTNYNVGYNYTNRYGTATLGALGTVTISNSTITSKTKFSITVTENGDYTGGIRVSGKVIGASFTVSTPTPTDNCSFDWELTEGL